MTTPAPLDDWNQPRTVSGPVSAALGEEQLLVDPADVARRLHLDPAALTAEQRARIVDAIEDAQADLEAELNRPLVPTVEIREGVWPVMYPVGGTLDRATYPALADIYDDVKILEATANADGTFNLTLQIGLNAAEEAPILRYVRAHAVESLRLDPQSGMGQLAVTSVSAEGQSISYEKRSTQEGAVGSLPSLRSLRRYKRLSVYQAPSRATAPWPYTGVRRRF